MKTAYRCILLLLLWLPLSGCATNSLNTSDDQQNSSGMSEGGMGRGGGRDGGGPQQGPPNIQQKDSETDAPPPIEAFAACEKKQEGDYVLLILSDGKELKATCQLIDDHMVAVPKKTKKPARR